MDQEKLRSLPAASLPRRARACASYKERKAEYTLSTDVPLQLVREEHRLIAKIADLEQQ